MRKRNDRDGIYLRNGQFYISYIDAWGRRKQRKTHAQTLKQARSLRGAQLMAAEKQRVLGYASPSTETFIEFIPKYLDYQKSRLQPKGLERTRGIVEKHLKKGFAGCKLADIRKVDVERYVTERATCVSPGSVVKELNVLKHLLSRAVEWGLLSFNYSNGVKPPRAPEGRVRYLQPEELKVLLKLCPLWLRSIVLLLIATGMRRGELLNLRWLDVDRKGNRIQIPQSKNGHGRTVWLNDLACRVLDSFANKTRSMERVIEKVVYFSPENVSVSFLRACRVAGIENFRLHDLRHTCASWMRMRGADIHMVALQLGHRDLRMAARYQHLAPAYLQAAVRGLDDVFEPDLARMVNGSVSSLPGNDSVTIEHTNHSEEVRTSANCETA